MTIHQLAKPCWVLAPNPHDDDDRLSHYGTHAEAGSALAGERRDADGDDEEVARLAAIRATELPQPCWVAECDAPGGPEGCCSNTLGDEDEGPSCIHFETLDELLEWMPGEQWVRSGADGVLCYSHRPDDTPPIPPSPAELEAAGQLRLPGVAWSLIPSPRISRTGGLVPMYVS